ncbi:DUF523 domain-containing protein [Mycoplasma sp. P36-A1]|uniref:DUF523 domain-containing protein n=1 Tax=Mycoplasma sp. P36-A1 TaxID=3252900 RepID=UPI003C2CA731
MENEMIAMSACLKDIKVKYNGESNNNHKVDSAKILLICPEVYGGLSTPRNPVEIVATCKRSNTFEQLKKQEIKILDKQGNDYSKQFLEGALKTLELLENNNIKRVILKTKSPSCGINKVYDGTFSNQLVNGSGILASLLKEKGYQIEEK